MDNFLTFFDSLQKINAISNVWRYVLRMLQTKYGADDDFLKLLCIFFSFIDDGCLCIPMNPDDLKEKWDKKLDTLDTTDCEFDYDTIIQNGILAVRNHAAQNSLITEDNGTNNVRDDNLFVIRNGWLFTEKFFHAKQRIEKCVQQLFHEMPTDKDSDEYKKQNEIIKKYPKNYDLDDKQTEAIIRATHGANLIITGGPGTGKTTVICYLLLELLAKSNCGTVYMAAPSGKAAKRMQESIIGALDGLRDEIKSARATECKKISTVEPLTIHRLLGLSGINKHQTTKFPANSIFIIDEASMIDVVLFAKLMDMICMADGARVFILGDRDQIPSVQPGAVFSELTQMRGDSIVELITSQRFRKNSAIYDLKEFVRNPNTDSSFLDNWADTIPDNWQDELQENQNRTASGDKKYPVQYLALSDADTIRRAATQWYDAFYDNCEYERVYSGLDLGAADITDTLDKIWAGLTQAKILCAENHGATGTENINKTICEYVKGKYHLNVDDNEKFFVGEQIIITKNQYMYDLSNGDIGVIVSIDSKKYIMIKRASDTGAAATGGAQIIRHSGNYIFYPVYLLPTDAVQAAYAITIHKSQGSEYENILVFLPAAEKSPLLNREILYTAITRTKNATYIVSNKANLIKAANTPVIRDTRLFM